MLTAIIPSHQVASWLLVHIDALLDRIGLSHDQTLEEVIYVAIIVTLALLLGWLVRRAILWLARTLVRIHHTSLGDELLRRRVLSRCSHIIPPLVIMGLLPFAFNHRSPLLHTFEKLVVIYTIVVITVAVTTIVTFIWVRLNDRENTKNLPLNGILNVCNGVAWIIAVIVAGSVLLDKSPVALLTGLGAFAAALMLIFKDSILGFVAGIQLAQNDMLRVGDWIVVPSTIANGIVEDVSLTAVKVRNWDNTIVTLPPYTLVSTSFQNWRGMSQSGWRLISRSILFDVDSVHAIDPTQLSPQVSQLPGVSDFVAKVAKSGQQYDPGIAVVNGTDSTNLGLLRAYLCHYLLHHPLVATDQQILVRIMTPAPEGLPLNIYCYTSTAWTAYEAVQSEIFEHIAVVAPLFGLRLYNAASGRDLRSLAEGSQKNN